MKRLAVLVAAILLGAAAGEVLCHLPAFRDLAGRIAGRGGLVSIVSGKGIYESDLGGDEELSASDAAFADNLRRAAAGRTLDSVRLEERFTALQNQFGDADKFRHAMRSAGLKESSLRENLEERLRELDWLETQVAAGSVAVTETECRAFYNAHPDLFALPVRYRAAHLFLAAPAQTPPEIVAEKEKAMAELATRLREGEPFADLVAEASEDEATKNRRGDLGYFAETRMPAEFISEIRKLRVGETSAPFRSHLGFHIAQLTEIKPAGVLRFEEARPEIAQTIANERRASAVDRIAREISAFASR